MADIYRPRSAEDLSEVIKDAAKARTPVEIIGSRSKSSIGKPLQTSAAITTSELKGVTLYRPTELVLSARAGTPVSYLEEVLANEGQQMAFEPLDYGPALGKGANEGTIGAVFAANLSGSRRIKVGAARDHFLGLHAVNGRGEIFKSGGKVMKNVTGYDLCKGLSGSWGTLSVLSEVTMKVMPRAETEATLFLVGLSDKVGVGALCTAMGLPYEVSGTVHLQAAFTDKLSDPELQAANQNITAVRLENFQRSINYRSECLREEMSTYGDVFVMDAQRSQAFWDNIRRLSFLAGGEAPVWRLSLSPKRGPEAVASIARTTQCHAVYDWSGGLVWLEVPVSLDAGATDIRRIVTGLGGHATLIRATPSVRAAVDVFHPLEPGVMRLTKEIKKAFDPQGILNPGRMYAGV